ncbi:MAG: MOSC domain-containing protein [Gaiellaceae bacterium]
MGTVAWITIAPVKSLALQRLDEVRLERSGAVGDRRFFLVDADGRLFNAERLGPLVGVQARYDEAGSTLELRFPGGEVVSGEVSTDGAVETRLGLFGGPHMADTVVGPWADALSSFAGREVRLVRPRSYHATDRGSRGGVSLVSTAALDALAAETGSGPVDERRFRMLLGVDGTAAHAEDAWVGHRVRIGEAVAELHGNVGRCVITTQHPDTGIRDLDTLRTLKEYRGAVPTTERLPFGVWGEVVEPGSVRLGDPVEPL